MVRQTLRIFIRRCERIIEEPNKLGSDSSLPNQKNDLWNLIITKKSGYEGATAVKNTCAKTQQQQQQQQK